MKTAPSSSTESTSTEDRQVDSEEQRENKEIEVNERALPSSAMATHERIRQDGEKELERDGMALLWSAIAAGLSMVASMIAKGIIHMEMEGVAGQFLLENVGYTFGFIIVIMARQQLFTENTVTVVLPIMQNPTAKNFSLLARLWSIVLIGNLIGTGLAAGALTFLPLFNQETLDAFSEISHHVMNSSANALFVKGALSGWIIATMVWMLAAAGSAKIWVIMLMTWLVAVGDLTHIVVGSVEVFYLVFNGEIAWQDFIWPFALPTLAGNIFGGTFIFALISHVQIRNDISEQRRLEEKQ